MQTVSPATQVSCATLSPAHLVHSKNVDFVALIYNNAEKKENYHSTSFIRTLV